MHHILANLVAALILLTSLTNAARADLSQKQARKAIARMGGFKLDEKAIRIDSITSEAAGLASVVADIETVFRLSQIKERRWQVSELRTGPGSWEDIAMLVEATKSESLHADCNGPPFEVGLNATKARCVIANQLGTTPTSPDIRIKELSVVDLSIGQASALVVARLRCALELGLVAGEWQVGELRCANGGGFSLVGFRQALDQIKRQRAANDLATIASALEAFRKERGSFVITDKESVLIDHLSPKFLHSVIRLDPWHNPYLYTGSRDSFSLSSPGPDGKPNTQDDIVFSH